VSAILEQLELNQTFFIQFGIFCVLFFFLSRFYFKPFLKLFHHRHERTVEDRQAAEKMVTEAKAKLEEYRSKIAHERTAIRADLDATMTEARKEEAKILNAAREEAKKITQDAVTSVSQQRETLKKQLQADVESLAKTISDTLIPGKH